MVNLVWKGLLDFLETQVLLVGWVPKAQLAIMEKMATMEIRDFLEVLVIAESLERMECLAPQVQWGRRVHLEVPDLLGYQVIRDLQENGAIL